MSGPSIDITERTPWTQSDLDGMSFWRRYGPGPTGGHHLIALIGPGDGFIDLDIVWVGRSQVSRDVWRARVAQFAHPREVADLAAEAAVQAFAKSASESNAGDAVMAAVESRRVALRWQGWGPVPGLRRALAAFTVLGDPTAQVLVELPKDATLEAVLVAVCSAERICRGDQDRQARCAVLRRAINLAISARDDVTRANRLLEGDHEDHA